MGLLDGIDNSPKEPDGFRLPAPQRSLKKLKNSTAFEPQHIEQRMINFEV
jgi:hypothetical protein